jgi:hypothetical protein
LFWASNCNPPDLSLPSSWDYRLELLAYVLTGKKTTLWRLLKNLNIDIPYDPAIPLLGIYPKECDSGYSRGTCTPMFIAVLFTIAKLWKQPRCPTTDEWSRKCGIYTQWNFMQPRRRMKCYHLQVNG